ncbi:MAG: exopolysaccharide biosynthesis polyprenyl glycosylphosphotransferase [Lentisphaeria bacterium]|nr:exopolysaccharide biosynthesis polyprenyl glycosylphosphotransferase [Lentisphaeria bacterium]NQZ68633.1 exopolysaccharide biosynthesis polyprenyl glycosylphosphotransferase [Lentisphaeria bacterium]
MHIKKQHWFISSLHSGVDYVIMLLAFAAAIFCRFDSQDAFTYLHLFTALILIASLSVPVLLFISGMYSIKHRPYGASRIVTYTTLALMLFLLAVLLLSFIMQTQMIGRGVVILSCSFAFSSLLLHHYIIRKLYQSRYESIAVLFSTTDEELRFKQEFSKRLNIDYTLQINNGEDVIKLDQTKLARVHKIVCSNTILHDYSDELSQLQTNLIPIVPLVSLYEDYEQRCPLDAISSQWFIELSQHEERFYKLKLKRLIDLVIALPLLILSTPLLALLAVLIKLSSKGPALFTQERLGEFGKPFIIYKLRTMTTDAEDAGPQWSQKNDPRVTFIGRLLRLLKLDEIPQLYNVVKGDMSFIGPRPERPEFDNLLKKHFPYFEKRLLIRPGISGWAQIHQSRSESIDDSQRKLEYDLYYLKHANIMLDIFIIVDSIRLIFIENLLVSKLKFKRDTH